MSGGWDNSAAAWVAHLGERGDWAREHVLDPAMLERVALGPARKALDVGCGEGRFCRMLKGRGIAAIGLDPTAHLLEVARQRDPEGDYRHGRAEELAFPDHSFDLVISYLTLIDIADYQSAIREMSRVLAPGGRLLIANMNGFVSQNAHQGWVRDDLGNRLHYPIDRYLEEFSEWCEWKGIRIQNWHRPLSAYMKTLLACGLTLTHFDEPEAISGDPALQAKYRRVPWFLVMEWEKPLSA